MTLSMTAMGKPGSPLRALYIGTLAPAVSGWWHDLVDDGTHGSTYVQALRGNPERWDQWPEIRRCNPLTAISPPFRKKLLEERDAARADSRLKARFLSYRLNVPSGDESTMLLTVDDWERVTARPVPEREGRPIVGVDLGGGRAWSAAVAVWRSGRVEAIAVAPGVPDLEAQEKRDRVPWGTYRKLALSGALRVASRVAGATARRARIRAVTRSVGRSGGHILRSVPARRASGRGERDTGCPARRAMVRSIGGHPGDPQGLALDGPLACAESGFPPVAHGERSPRSDGQERRSRQRPAGEARDEQHRRAMTSRRRSCSRPGRSRALRSRGGGITA